MTAPPLSSELAITLALSLAQAESAIEAFSAGQIDAIVDGDGKAYLLRPAQERLRQNEIRLQAVLDSVTDAVAVISRGGIVVSQNRAGILMLGTGPEGMVGRSLFDFIHPDDLPQLYSAFFNVIEGFTPRAIVVFRCWTKGGSYRLLESTVDLLREGSPASIVLSARDLTLRLPTVEEIGRRETALAEAAHARDVFLSMLSHELRVPLAPILLGIAELQSDKRFADAGPTLAMMRRNLTVQARLLDELLDYARVGGEKVRVQPETLDAHETVRLALEVCQGEIAAKEIQVVLDLRARQSLVQADPAKLQQVMWNLIKNAVKFSAPGGSLTIASRVESERIAIEFADSGIGIDAELLPFVFDAFHQGALAAKHSNDGLGLGLYIAKGLAEAQGGTLSVASEGLDRGTAFLLTLPQHRADAG